MNKGIGVGGWVAVVFILLLLVGGINALTGNTTSDDAAWPCEYFTTAYQDVRDGVITITEFRARLVEVNDRASIASGEIQAAARRVLAAVTSGTSVEIAGALGGMRAACAAAGVAG